MNELNGVMEHLLESVGSRIHYYIRIVEIEQETLIISSKW